MPVEIGIESININTLKWINKSINFRNFNKKNKYLSGSKIQKQIKQEYLPVLKDVHFFTIFIPE